MRGTAMATSIRTRKALQPVRGSCQWLSEPNRLHQGGVLEINGTAYTVEPVLDDEDRLVGHRLSKADGAMYDIDRATGRADCPDATFRPHPPGRRTPRQAP